MIIIVMMCNIEQLLHTQEGWQGALDSTYSRPKASPARKPALIPAFIHGYRRRVLKVRSFCSASHRLEMDGFKYGCFKIAPPPLK